MRWLRRRWFSRMLAKRRDERREERNVANAQRLRAKLWEMLFHKPTKPWVISELVWLDMYLASKGIRLPL